MGKVFDKKMRIMFAVILISVLFIIHAFSRFRTSFFEMELESKQKELEEISRLSIIEMQEEYANIVSALEFVSTFFTEPLSMDDQTMSRSLQWIRDLTVFKNVGAADLEGNLIDSENKRSNISEESYFKEAVNGNAAISEVIYMEGSEDVQIIAVPIKNGTEITGVLKGVLDVDAVERKVNDEYLSDIYVQIADSEGDYVTRMKDKDALMKHSNVWADFEEYEFVKGSLEQLRDDVTNQRSGYVTFKAGNEERVSHYAPLGINNYYVYSTTNSKYLKDRTSEINKKAFWMSAEMAGAFLVLMIGLYWYSKKVQEELLRSHQEVASSEEMMRIAIRETDQMVFEYNIHLRELHTKEGKNNSIFQWELIKHVPESILDCGMIDENSVHEFKQLFEQIKTAEACEAVVQITIDGNKKWLKIMMKNIYDSKHQIVNTVGIVEDVTEKKKQEQRLENQQRMQEAIHADSFMTCKVNLQDAMVLEVNGEPWKASVSYEKYLKENIFSKIVGEELQNVISLLSEEHLISEYKKGKESIEIQFRMKYHEKERWISCKVYLMEDTENKDLQALITFRDINRRKEEELKLQERAERDGLTGLYNASTIRMKIDGFLKSSCAAGERHMFVLIDLDNFKEINDTFGHQWGDQVLKDVSAVLTRKFRHNDIVGRLGGDEFVIMVLNVQEFSVMEHIFEELVKELHMEYEQNGVSVSVSASLGIAAAPEHGTSFEELYQKSDQMLYEVKRNMKNGYKLYTE